MKNVPCGKFPVLICVTTPCSQPVEVAVKPKPSGNGQSGVAAKSKPPVDDELEDEPPAQPPVKATDADEFDDEIDF